MIFWYSFLGLLYLVPFLSVVRKLFSVLAIFLTSTIQLITKKEICIALPLSISQWINLQLGRYEYLVQCFRNFIIVPIIVVHLVLVVCTPEPGDLYRFIAPYFFLIVLTIRAHYHEIMASLKISEFLRTKNDLHPQIFFNHFYQLLGPLKIALPDPSALPGVNPQNVSFSETNRPKRSFWPLIPAVYDTARLAHISLKILKYVGPNYAREIFDLMSSMWGKRVLQVFKASLVIHGEENLKNLSGKNIIIFNHKSQLDYVFSFFALSHLTTKMGRELRPRFIVARDHFKNPFVYDVLGIGRLIETVYMVFVERRKSKIGFQNLEEAAQFLINKDIDLAIYPQGTRSEGNTDRSGKRRDSGYYTTIALKDVNQDLGHLRKGAAFLATDTLMLMRSDPNEKLNLIFIGVKGTALLMPKQHLDIQTETQVEFIIGKPLALKAEMAIGCHKPHNLAELSPQEEKYLHLVNEIHHQIDENLISVLNIDEALKHRFLLDVQGQINFSKEKLLKLEQVFERLPQDDHIVYQIIDRIYACSILNWNSYLSQLSQILLEGSGRNPLVALREQVTQTMLGTMKSKKLHGKKIK